MMKEIPLVSIFITSYNQEAFIEEAVLSVVNQDYLNIQVVISDDGSTDSSKAILRRLADSYPGKIEIHLHQDNRGSTWNHNFAYQQCRGDFICYFDGDDVMLPGKISKQVVFMKEHPEYCMSYHDNEIFQSDIDGYQYLWSERFGTRTGSAKDVVRFGNYLPSLAMMVRKNSKRIEFNQDILLSADWLFWIDQLMATNGRIGYMDQVLGRYRRHENNVTLNWKKKINHQIVSLDIIENRYPMFKTQAKKRRADIYLIQSIYMFGKRERKDALKILIKSLKLFSPIFFLILRLPIRELIFYKKSKMKFDDLIQTLIGN